MTKKLGSVPEKSGRVSSDKNQDFMTFDLGCASALVSSGLELVSLDKSNPKKVQFVFKREAGIEKIVNDYFADKLEVKARKFFDDIKSIKNRIYSSE